MRRPTGSAARRARWCGWHRPGLPVPARDRRDHRSVRGAAGRRPRRCPRSLAAPGAPGEDGRARRGRSRPRRGRRASSTTLVREVDTLVPEPGARFAVRSSAKIEDKAGALAAGLFLSRVDVARGEVLGAVREVLGSALAPAVDRLPRRSTGCAPTRSASRCCIHRTSSVRRRAPPPSIPPRPTRRSSRFIAATRRCSRSAPRSSSIEAVRTLAATLGPVEVEWVSARRRDHVSAAAPLPAPGAAALAADGARRAPTAGRPARTTPTQLAAADDWRWDAAHNPLPLSPAQAGLVELVDARCRTGLRQRVVGGYLFYATDPTSETAPIGAADALRACAKRRRERLARPTPTLEEALETFLAIYQPLFGVVQPNARAARGGLAAFLRRSGFDPGPLMPKLLAGVPSAATERRTARARAGGGRRCRRRAAPALTAYLDGSATRRRAGTSPRRPGGRHRRRSSAWCAAPPSAPPWTTRAWKRGGRGGARAAARRRARPSGRPSCRRARRRRRRRRRRRAVRALQAHVRRALLREGERLWKRGVIAEAERSVLAAARRSSARTRAAKATIALRAGRDAVDRGARRRRRRARQPAAARRRRQRWTWAADVVRGRPGAGGARIGRGADLSRRSRPTNTTTTPATCWSRARCCRPSCRCCRRPPSSSRPAASSTTSPRRPASAPSRPSSAPSAPAACYATAIRSSSTAARASSSACQPLSREAELRSLSKTVSG